MRRWQGADDQRTPGIYKGKEVTRYMLKILRRFIKEESRNSLDMGNQVNMVSDRELIIRERSGTI